MKKAKHPKIYYRNKVFTFLKKWRIKISFSCIILGFIFICIAYSMTPESVSLMPYYSITGGLLVGIGLGILLHLWGQKEGKRNKRILSIYPVSFAILSGGIVGLYLFSLNMNNIFYFLFSTILLLFSTIILIDILHSLFLTLTGVLKKYCSKYLSEKINKSPTFTFFQKIAALVAALASLLSAVIALISFISSFK